MKLCIGSLRRTLVIGTLGTAFYCRAVFGDPAPSPVTAPAAKAVTSPAAATVSPPDSATYAAAVKQAVASLKERSQANDPAAEVCLGNLYLVDTDVPYDPGQALAQFQRAAALKDARGMAQADRGLLIGGDPRFYVYAVNDLKKLSVQRNAAAQTILGTLYLYGYTGAGVSVDPSGALKLFLEAAAQKEPDAEVALARIYRRGLGVPKDNKRAAYWQDKAAGHVFDCLSDFDSQAYGLVEENLEYPADVVTGKVSGQVRLWLNSAPGPQTALEIAKSSGYPELDAAALKAVRGLILPVWTGGTGHYVMPIEFNRRAADYAWDTARANALVALIEGIRARSNQAWANHPHHSADAAAPGIGFICKDHRTDDVTLLRPSDDSEVDQRNLAIIRDMPCFEGMQATDIPTEQFKFMMIDPWDGNFDDPADLPQTPYGKKLRDAVVTARVVPKHALVFGTTGTGAAQVAFDARDDKVSAVTLLKSSEDPDLDAAALDAVRQAKLPAPPRDQKGKDLHVVMYVNFPVGWAPPRPAAGAASNAAPAAATVAPL
jgi:TonB family protein